jgi:hypothetical protein
MMRYISVSIVTAVLMCGCSAYAASPDTKGDEAKGNKVCRMEQQCRWDNFKKICTWVKVCR